jgi:large subunit ribosomal protein L22
VSARRSSTWSRDHPRQEGREGTGRSDLLAPRIAGDVKKTLESAIANAENNHDLDVDELVVAEAYVGKNLVMKRFTPRARGRVGRIQKPFFSEITMSCVRQVEEAA